MTKNIPLLLRIMTDTMTVTALLMIALFHFLDRGKSSRYFGWFSFSLAAYVFFDNTLSMLVFDPRLVAKINTLGVSLFSLSILLSYLLFISQILGIPHGRRFWMKVCVALGLLCLSLNPFVWIFGWEWYMIHVDAWGILLYVIVFVLGSVFVFAEFFGRKMYRSKIITLILFSSWIMIVSLFVYRILINLDTANFLINNSILIGGMAFLFPLFLSSKNNAEFQELQRLYDEKEMLIRKKSGDLRSLFQGDQTLKAKPGHREIEVCEALLEGLEYKEIAAMTDLSLSGVKKRVHSLYGKMGVQNRTELFNRIALMRDPENSQPASKQSVPDRESEDKHKVED